MLDAFIIEEIKRQEREQTADDRPVVELPVPPPPAEPVHRDEDRDDRGSVVIIDYAGAAPLLRGPSW